MEPHPSSDNHILRGWRNSYFGFLGFVLLNFINFVFKKRFLVGFSGDGSKAETFSDKNEMKAEYNYT